jgi:hypothetical protein
VAVVEQERPKAVQSSIEKARPGAALVAGTGQVCPAAAETAVDVKRVQVQHRLL